MGGLSGYSGNSLSGIGNEFLIHITNNVHFMKWVFKKLAILFVLMVCIFQTSVAQQKNVANLIVQGMNETNIGFPSFMPDTIRNFGWKLKPAAVAKYEGIKDVEFFFTKDFTSILVKDAAYTINKMRIRSETIRIPFEQGWTDYKDTLTAYYNKQVDYFKLAFGKQLGYTSIITLQDETEEGFKPRYITYFYNKAIQLPANLTNTNEIEKQLDISNWFTVELQKQMLTPNYNIVYQVSGGQKQ